MTEVTAEQVISKLHELDLHLSPGINYRLETIFLEVEGFFVNKKIREKFQWIQKIEPFLKEVLLEDEQVLFVSEGGRGLDFQRMIFVLTKMRLLCLHLTGMDYGCPYWMIYLSQVEALKNSVIMENPRFYLKDGTQLRLRDFSRQELPTLHDVFKEASQQFQEEGLDPPVSQSKEHLCGNCFAIVAKQANHCEACGATFWTPFEIGIRSLILPAWGSFLIRPFSFALMEQLSYVLLGFSILVLEVKDDFVVAGVLFALLNATAAMGYYKLTAKGLYLKEVPADS